VPFTPYEGNGKKKVSLKREKELSNNGKKITSPQKLKKGTKKPECFALQPSQEYQKPSRRRGKIAARTTTKTRLPALGEEEGIL